MPSLPDIVPLKIVCRDYFSHLSPAQLERNIITGKIRIPLIVIDPSSQKAAKGVLADDLEKWLRERHAVAVKDMKNMNS